VVIGPEQVESAVGAALTDAARNYRNAVASGEFPGEEHAY